MDCPNCGDEIPRYIDVAKLHFHVCREGHAYYKIECYGASDPQHDNPPYLTVEFACGEHTADTLRALADVIERGNLNRIAQSDADRADAH